MSWQGAKKKRAFQDLVNWAVRLPPQEWLAVRHLMKVRIAELAKEEEVARCQLTLKN